MTSRISAWFFSLFSLVCSVGYCIWVSNSTTLPATEANLYPGPVLGRIFSQLAEAAPFLDWNIPWLSLLVWAAWLFGTLCLGSILRIVLKFRHPEESAATELALSFGIGFVVVSLAQLLLGLVGLARLPLIPVLAVVSSISLVLPTQRQNLTLLPRALRWQWSQLPGPAKILLLLTALGFSLLLIPALTPPVQSDGVRYHIGAVQEYLKASAIRYLPSNAYSNMPFLVEMHFMAALACRAPEATQLIHLTLALFTSLGIYALCSSLAGHADSRRLRLIPLAAAALYLATPMSAVLATWPFTDHGISFFLIASAIAVSRPVPFSRAAAVQAGLLLGGLIGTKYTVVPIAGALFIIPFLAAKFDNPTAATRARLPISSLLTAAIVTALVGGVWFIKNFVFTDNPFYPLASSIFPGGEWTAEANAFLHSRADSKGMGKGVLQLLLSPWNATFHWLRFESHNVGPTLLLSVIACFAAAVSIKVSPRRGTLIGLLLVILFSYAIWFFSYQANRLLLPTLALMLAVTPAWLFACEQRRFSVRLPIAYAIAATYGLLWALQWSFVVTALTPPPLPYLLGNQDRNVYRYQSLTYARAYDYLNQRVKPGEKVLLVGEHRIYGAQFEAVWSDWFDTPMLAEIMRTQKISTLEKLLQYLASQNIRWVLINEAELAPQLETAFRPRLKPAEWKVFEQLRQLDSSDAKRITLPPGVTILHLDNAR